MILWNFTVNSSKLLKILAIYTMMYMFIFETMKIILTARQIFFTTPP